MEGNPIENRVPEVDKRELTPTEKQELFSKWKTPLDVILPGINIAGLNRDEEFKRYEAPTDEITLHNSYHEGRGDGAGTEYIMGILDYFNPGYKKSAEVLGIRNFIEPFFKGRVVVDLGAGDAGGYYLARECHAKGYISVDKFRHPFVDYRIQESLFHGGSKAQNIPFAVVMEDMLEFLRRLPAESVSILTSAVTVGIRREYAHQVEDEIVRVLDPQGAYITHFSEFTPETLKMEKSKHYPDRWGGLVRFTK